MIVHPTDLHPIPEEIHDVRKFHAVITDVLEKPHFVFDQAARANLFINQAERQVGVAIKPKINGLFRFELHRDDVGAERPLLVDPAAEEPSDFVRFRRHMPYAPRGNARGVETIRVLGLDRIALRDRRRELFARLRALADVARQGPTEALRTRARAALVRCAQADAEFSAMARDFLVEEDDAAGG